MTQQIIELNVNPADETLSADVTNMSAGIDIRGFTQGVFVGNNRIRGRARAAVAVEVFNGGIPGNTALVLNRIGEFDASVAGVIVGDGVSGTLILGQQGAVNDHGLNTVILPFGSRPGSTQ